MVLMITMEARAKRFAWWLARYGALLLALAGLAELLAHFYFSQRAPRQPEYDGLVAAVDGLRGAGELVVVAPAWAEPMVRKALGDERMPLSDLGRPDVDGYAAAVEISILGQEAGELSGWQEQQQQSHGRFRLRRLTNPTPRPVKLDFVTALSPQTRVFMSRAPSKPCRWWPKAPLRAGGLGGHPTFPAQRFVCPGSAFLNVGVTVIADQDFRPRRCLWAHPPASGALVIRYPKVDLAETIVGHGGMYWIIERTRKGAPVELLVKVDGELVGRATHADGDGWSPFSFALGQHAGKRGASVSFSISSPDYRHRHFCFEARTR